MAFTANELTNIANASLEWYFNKGDTFKQSIQAKPLLDLMERKKKTFSGGNEDISVAVKGNYGDVDGGGNDVLAGYTHDDTVAFYTPGGIDRASWKWKEHHIGLTMTHTELKIDGISVVDEFGKTGKHTRREMHVLVNLLKSKLEDLGEQYARSMNTLLWNDGSGAADEISGIRSLITENPEVGTIGGINRANDAWWKNIALTTANAGADTLITSSPTNGGALLQALQSVNRRLVRYGSKPDTFLCGSDFLEAAEIELRANGQYTDSGYTKTGDVSMASLKYKGTTLRYDPTLDDLGKSKFGYWFDSSSIFLMAMEQEWRKNHAPARPSAQFLLHRSITCTGQVVGKQLNGSAVLEIA